MHKSSEKQSILSKIVLFHIKLEFTIINKTQAFLSIEKKIAL